MARSPALVAPSRQVLAARLGYEFHDAALLERAMTHRSWCAESPDSLSNERLEFLGDAVLGMLVGHYVFEHYPELPEGRLTELRKAVVSEDPLTELALDLGIGEALMLGRGEATGGGRLKHSILADAAEAIIGAIYLDGGIEAARDFVLREVVPRLDAGALTAGDSDYKTRLQEQAVRKFKGPPVYRVAGDGPDHEKVFTATVELDGVVVGTGAGRSKKQAEQRAASEALIAIHNVKPAPTRPPKS